MKVKAWSSVAVWSAIGLARVGASLMLATVTLKVSKASAPALSVTVTTTSRVPTSPLAGVPVKVRVAASNFSHAGKAAPLASLAV